MSDPLDLAAIRQRTAATPKTWSRAHTRQMMAADVTALAAEVERLRAELTARPVEDNAVRICLRQLKDLKADIRGLLAESGRTPCAEQARSPTHDNCAVLCTTWRKKLQEHLM